MVIGSLPPIMTAAYRVNKAVNDSMGVTLELMIVWMLNTMFSEEHSSLTEGNEREIKYLCTSFLYR